MVATPPPPPFGPGSEPPYSAENSGNYSYSSSTNPVQQPPSKRPNWLIPTIAAVLGVVLVLVLAVVFIVAANNDDDKPPVMPAPSTASQNPTPEPSATDSSSGTEDLEAIGETVKDSFSDFSRYSTADGFQVPANGKYRVLGAGSTVQCSGQTIDGSNPKSFPAFWCQDTDTLLVSSAAFLAAEDQGGLTREAYLMTGWGVALADANGKSSLDFVACAVGTVARSDVDDKVITFTQAEKIRNFFYPADSKATQHSAFTAGYNGATKATCDAYN